jgi:hypothetical protein
MDSDRMRDIVSRMGAVAVVAAVIVVWGGVLSARAATPGGYSVRPVEIDQKDPATRAYFKPVLKPGETTTLHVEVTNRASNVLRLRVDAVDGLTGQTSGAVYANRQDPLHKAGTWVTPAEHEIEISALGKQTVAFTVAVPRDARAGDHVAGIAFENEAVQSSGSGFSVKQVIREVVGIQIRVPGVASTHLTIGSLGLQSLPGTAFASVIVNLSNTGELLCKPALTVTLHSPNGDARSVSRQLDTILPGDTIAYPLPWPDSLAAGKYVARASTSACGPAFATADVPLVLEAPLNGSAPSSELPTYGVKLPNLSIVFSVGFALAGLLFGLLLGKRRRRDEKKQPIEIPPVPAHVQPLAASASDLRRIRKLDPPAARLDPPPTRLEQTKRLEEQPPEKNLSDQEQQRLWP